MSIRPVRIYGDPVLRQRAAPVAAFDESLRRLAADMHETMHAYHGVGLAGNQIGVAQRILVVDVPGDEGSGAERVRHDVVNPVIRSRSGSDSAEEGCLSIPGIWEDVTRALEVTVEAQDLDGKPLEIEASGYLARVLQHEIDHLDGVLFTDRLSLLKRQFLRRALDALARGELPPEHRPRASAEGG